MTGIVQYRLNLHLVCTNWPTFNHLLLCRDCYWLFNFLVSEINLELNAGCFDRISEDVVQALPLFNEIIVLNQFDPTNLMESNQSSLVKGNH